MNQDLKQYTQLHDENIELKKKLNDYKKQITELNNKLFNERRKSTILNEDLKSSNFLFNLDIQDIDPEIKQIVDKEYYNMLNCGEIEKAAEKHADTIIDAGETYHGFIAGTKWAIERLKGEINKCTTCQGNGWLPGGVDDSGTCPICNGLGYESKKAEIEWISVNDRLPEIGKYVIVITEYTMNRKPSSDTFMGYMNEIGELIELPNDDFYGWLFNDCVIHWMPLPEPPKQ